MTHTLAVDTTILGASVGIFDHRGASYQSQWVGHYLGRDGSAKTLNGLLADGLKAIDRPFSSISQVAISVGPGSFTGIKVGLAWVYGLGMGAAHCLKFASLSAIEEAGRAARVSQASSLAAHKKKNLVFAIGATRSHGYIAEVCGDDTVESRLINLESEDDRDHLRQLADDSCFVVGNNWPLLTEFLGHSGLCAVSYDPEVTAAHAIDGMMASAYKLSARGLFREDLPVPKYMRKSTAEEKLAIQGGIS